MRIWFAGSTVGTVVVSCDWNLFSYFTVGCKQFCSSELIFRYLEFVFAGATFECSFCRVIGFERIAPTAHDAVGDVMVWIAIR